MQLNPTWKTAVSHQVTVRLFNGGRHHEFATGRNLKTTDNSGRADVLLVTIGIENGQLSRRVMLEKPFVEFVLQQVLIGSRRRFVAE